MKTHQAHSVAETAQRPQGVFSHLRSIAGARFLGLLAGATLAVESAQGQSGVTNVAAIQAAIRRTALPQAAANPYEITPPPVVISSGTNTLAKSARLTNEIRAPKLPLNIFERDSVVEFHRMLKSVNFEDAESVGGIPIYGADWKILAATPQTGAGAVAIMMSVAAWRQMAQLNTVFDDTCNLYALSGATGAADRSRYMAYTSMHSNRDPSYYLTPEVAIGMGGGLLAGGAPLGARPTFNDGAHKRPLYNIDPYAVFGAATAGGQAQCIFIGGRAVTPTQMLLNGRYSLSAEGYVLDGTASLAAVYGSIQGLRFSPTGDNMNQLLRIHSIASYPGMAGRITSRLTFTVDPATGIFSFGLPEGYGADYSVDRRIDLRIEWRRTTSSPWEKIETWLEATKANTHEERLSLTKIVNLEDAKGVDGRPNGLVRADIVAMPGSHVKIECANKLGVWEQLKTFVPSSPSTTLYLDQSAIKDGHFFLRASTDMFAAREGREASLAGVPQARILK